MEDLKSITLDPRVTVRRQGAPNPAGKCVVYWMQRSQRALDNPALDIAVAAANCLRKPIVVFLAPIPFYPRANLRHYAFLSQGLMDIASGLQERGIGFVLRRYPDHKLLQFCKEVEPCLIIGDENPLHEAEHWREVVRARTKVPFWTVDADVIVPSRLMEKEQFAAYTIRPRIRSLLPAFLNPVHNLRPIIAWEPQAQLRSISPDQDITDGWNIDRTVKPVSSFRGGTQEGVKRLRQFISHSLRQYAQNRNHPELDATSHLSPYLHFGHLGPHTIALAVRDSDAPEQSKNAFLEELIVRRELAINFVRFNPEYESIASAPTWAHRTLAAHAQDQRPMQYSESQMEKAATHDPLWNAAHMQMVLTGWMHNYMRMYWAKKILEWSPSPAEAYQRAVRLNDKYELDGRDPNGYEGIAWAIAGKSDRPWFDRAIFGRVRYMSFESTSKKFDSKRYIQQITNLQLQGEFRLE